MENSLTHKGGHAYSTATSMMNSSVSTTTISTKTPSANLVVAANELARLEQTPEVAKVTAMLKVAHCQVNEIHQDQGASYLTSSICRPAAPAEAVSPTSIVMTNNPSRGS